MASQNQSKYFVLVIIVSDISKLDANLRPQRTNNGKFFR